MKSGPKNTKKVLIVVTPKVSHNELIVKVEKKEILMNTQEHLKWPEDKDPEQDSQSQLLNQIQ